MFRISILSFLILFPYILDAKVITDMAGRRVEIPEKIEKIVPFDNKTNMLLFPVAETKMCAKAWAGENSGMKMISESYLKMPEVDLQNAEEVLRLNPDILVVGTFVNKNTKKEITRYTKFAEKINKPLVVVDLELMNLDSTYMFLGELLNEKENGLKCVNFIRSVYSQVESYKSNPVKASAYIANSKTGLRTAPEGSSHAQIFELLGIENAIKAPMDAKGFSMISIEELMAVNPDYIFCMGKGNTNPYSEVKNSMIWKNLKAVKNNRLYNIPSHPFIWFDMPPSINRLCGLLWFCEIFKDHPSLSTKDKITEFYKIFYKYELSDKEYDSLQDV